MALNLLTDSDEFDACDKDLIGVSDGDPEVIYRLRKLDPVNHKRLRKAHTKSEFVRGIGKVDKTDDAAVADDIFDYVLIGWKNVLLNGQPADCTRELKLRGVDFTRRNALVDLAGMNEIAKLPERRAESFRAPA